MSAARKGFYYKRLRAAGVPLERHFRDYTLDELMEAHKLAEQNGLLEAPTLGELADLDARAHAAKVRKATTEQERAQQRAADRAAQATQQRLADPGPTTGSEYVAVDLPPQAPERRGAQTPARVPVRGPDPNEMAGQRQNIKDDDEPIRVDEHGRVWLQEEVRKPAYPKPRGRRVLRYQDPGVRQTTITSGEYTETFEVSGDPSNSRPAEVKITLPSYQVGIYRDPRFPFKVITYNGNNGFDRAEVARYYGGSELVPAEIKRIYVENVLCYDVRTTIRAIQSEYRQLQLTGTIPTQ